ncbi:1407_t:CDS:2 [Diversispora eburnea]|uniref:1407_t:CDS:1 n=1 Tax=Diversispora eburnea TaxID=1213867 RepID=A0A9N8ZDU8_9GLOM|nr:1407_t:CDS:2 [Diversispora eburnea]
MNFGNLTQEKLEKEKTEVINFDVGGTMYKTKRSTLINYPTTLLGQMVLDDRDEYFLDRNGRAFHYIMEFYRTGKPLWPDKSDGLTCEEVEREFEYFRIPLEKEHADTLAFKAAANTFDQIVSAFEEVIKRMYRNFDDKLYLTFSENGTSNYKGVQRIFSSLGGKEYILLTTMNAQIKKKLENTFCASRLKWEYKKVESFFSDSYIEVSISYFINPYIIAQYSKYS